ncbi:hypothetical protein TSOC_005792, partial [Tetrabaena socialis]
QVVEASKVPRARKARTPSVRSAPSNSSSISSSDAEPGSPRREPHARQAVVIESQGAGKVMQRPDGTVVWEPEQERTPQLSRGGGLHPSELLSLAGAALGGVSMVVGAIATTNAMRDGPYGHPACLTSRQLTAAVAHSVTCFVAGTTAGMVLGPLLAARAVASVLVRPAMVGLLVHGGIKCVRNWRSGVAGLLRKLQSADPARVMEALRAIIAAAGRSPKFAREFNSEAHAEAVGALHNALRGCPDNQRALAALPSASEVLRGALGGYGPCWHPAKGDLHALLNVLARLQGVQEAGGFVVIQSQAAAAAGAGPSTPAAASPSAATTAAKA